MAFRENGNYGKTYYLNINSNGNLYERSNEPKEGFVEHINSQTGALTGYWKEYYNGLTGYIDNIMLRSVNGKSGPITYLCIAVKDYELDERYSISIPLTNTKGGIKNYVKSFVKFYENIDFSREIVFNAFKKKKDAEFGSNELNLCYVGADGKDEMIERHFKKGVNGWPETVKVMGFNGKETYDSKEQDNFAYNKLLEYINDFNSKITDIRYNLEKKYEEKAIADAMRAEKPAEPATYQEKKEESKPAWQQPQQEAQPWQQPVQEQQPPKQPVKQQPAPGWKPGDPMGNDDLPF